MAIENSVSNDFDLRSSIVLTFSIDAYLAWTSLSQMSTSSFTILHLYVSLRKLFKDLSPQY